MKILSAAQIAEIDSFTIKKKPISSIDLMEKASLSFLKKFTEIIEEKNRHNILILCGPGNNGGDGLAIARLLSEKGYKINLLEVAENDKRSSDYMVNFERLKKSKCKIIDRNEITKVEPDIIIDAIFGIGLNREVVGFFKEVIEYINCSSAKVFSVDTPSGIAADLRHSCNSSTVKANYTISFQIPKLSFFQPECGEYVGDLYFVDIGLDEEAIDQVKTNCFFTCQQDLVPLLTPRAKFSHKGNFGHALLVAGSNGMLGAAVLSSKACLKSGVGLLSVQSIKSATQIIQSSVPEAMFLEGGDSDFVTTATTVDQFKAIAIGPGMGTQEQTAEVLHNYLKADKPLVLDADALNILSQNKSWLEKLPENSILTPHPGEFKRIFGTWNNDQERLDLLSENATKYNCTIVLKGSYTCICSNKGDLFFNSTGNSGMAKGGAGDVLTGLMVGILANYEDALSSAKLAVYLHGLAGDLAAKQLSEEGMNSGDIITYLPEAWKKLLQAGRGSYST